MRYQMFVYIMAPTVVRCEPHLGYEHQKNPLHSLVLTDFKNKQNVTFLWKPRLYLTIVATSELRQHMPCIYESYLKSPTYIFSIRNYNSGEVYEGTLVTLTPGGVIPCKLKSINHIAPTVPYHSTADYNL